ncbi:MAG: transglycosylase SLT domain-containing protein [Nanoarchaeota archaeon]|nr:transglycosylase SLT domain-containing protein [Nanoarchaeota archaeon]
MEREYTVGGLLVLVTIFVIALIIYFTVPEFSQSVIQIADEVFGTLPKNLKMGAEHYKEEEAKSVFESVKKCISQLKEKPEGECTCHLDYKGLPEEYYIRFTEDKKGLRLEKENQKISETENINIEGLKFCTLGKGFTYKEIPTEDLYLNSKGGALKIGNKEFLKDTPEFYSLKDGNNKYICFVTSDVGEEDSTKLRKIKDCKDGKIVLDDKMNTRFQDFIQLYKRCKQHNKAENCKCGMVNLDMSKPYEIRAVNEQGTTRFYLEGTNKVEIIERNKIAEIVNTPFYTTTPYTIEDNYYQGRKLEGQKEIVYYGNNQKIYLADPEIKALREWPLCIENVNIYLKFNPSISKEEYKQRVVKFSAKSEPYFDIVYAAAKTYDIDIFLIVAMIERESAWNHKILSGSGAVGLMQLMPYTAKDLGLNKEGPNYKCRKVSGYTICDCNSKETGLCDFKNDERFDPNKNVNAGVKYITDIIKQLDKNKKVDPTFENIVASYNAGPNAVIKYGGYKGIPLSFADGQPIKYVKAICGFYEKLNTKVCYA